MKQPTAGQSAQEYVSRYLRRRRALRIMRWAPLAAYVPLAYASVFSTLLGWALLVFLALFFLYLRAIRFLLAMQYSLKDLILTRDCDGEKYLAVCMLLAPTIRRTTGMIAIDTAKALYFTGRFEEAYAALPRPAPAQAKASVLLAYDNVLFNSALATGRLDEARQGRAHAAALPAAKHKGMEKAAASLLDLMDAALAFEAGDYDAFRTKTQAFLLTANTPLQKASSSYHLALADLKQGEWENARARLTFAAQHGGTLFFAAQAEALLREGSERHARIE